MTWEEQVQAMECCNAGATVLHVHVRNPATGKGSVGFDEYNYCVGLLRKALPKMILQRRLHIVLAEKRKRNG
jgi:uncharacterized protein (DUF849 family)